MEQIVAVFAGINVFTALSGIAILFAYYLFVVGTIRGPVKPNLATWVTWCVQDVLMAWSAIAKGVGSAAVMPIEWAIGAVIMLYLCITLGERKPFTSVEKVCLVLSGCGILLWVATGSPLFGLIASVSSAFFGSTPTIAKVWNKPETEPVIGWLLMLAGTIFSALSIEAWTFTSGIVPVVCGALQAGIVALIAPHAIKKYLRNYFATKTPKARLS